MALSEISSVFIEFLNMSITASWLILAVILIRFVFRNAPKFIRCILWGLVGVRLICPISFESIFSLIPSSETVPPDFIYSPAPSINSGIDAVNSTVNPVINRTVASVSSYTADLTDYPARLITSAVSVLWIVGIAAMLVYGIVSYLRIRRRVSVSVCMKDNIYLCDDISTPFILGMFRPRIYLPSDIGENAGYVVAHEKSHLKRRDHWWKPLGFIVLSVYWFNPLVWAAYILLCRDIELACDERVIKEMDAENKKAYSEALLSCSIPRRMIMACPLAFGEVGVKDRIKSVLSYKKPAFWVITVAVIACIVAALCFMTNPEKSQINGKEYDASKYYFSYVIGADRANREQDIQYKISPDFKVTKNVGEIMELGELTEYAETELTDLVYEKLPFYYRLIGCKKAYVTEHGDDVEESHTSYIFMMMKNGDLIGGILPQNSYVLEAFKLTETGEYTEESKAETYSTDSLDDAISAAIMNHYKNSYLKGDFACESHEILKEQYYGAEGKRKVYLQVVYREYNSSAVAVSGGASPVVMTFSNDVSDGYILLDFTEWSKSNKDSEEMKLLSELADAANCTEMLQMRCQEKAVKNFYSYKDTVEIGSATYVIGEKNGDFYISDGSGSFNSLIRSTPIVLGNSTAESLKILAKNENGMLKFGVTDGLSNIIPCEYNEISFLSEKRFLAVKGETQRLESSETPVIYDDKGNIICGEGIFTYVAFEKRNGVYEQTGIGAYNKNGDLRQADYWVIDQNGNKLSEAYTSIERVVSTNPQEAYYAVRIDSGDLYMDSYRLDSRGKVLEKVDRSHPDGVTDRTVVEGKFGNYIYLYGNGVYITGYNSRIGGYGYVAFEVENPDEWQIGDTVEITHTGKIKYSDPPLGELIDIKSFEE